MRGLLLDAHHGAGHRGLGPRPGSGSVVVFVLPRCGFVGFLKGLHGILPESQSSLTSLMFWLQRKVSRRRSRRQRFVPCPCLPRGFLPLRTSAERRVFPTFEERTQ